MSTPNKSDQTLPEILAPAGNQQSFLAAIAAGADAVYCGLKQFSARMKANNFTLNELTALTTLAKKKNVNVNLAINTLLKPAEIPYARYLLRQIQTYVKPDALIFSDLAMIPLAKEVGYEGELHLSTLGNLGFQKGLTVAEALGIDRVVVPRELSLDEINQMSQAALDNIGLETFIHGALCYAVSGRCYWSSWFGGKSGLRGQCVQPCRRYYSQENQKDRFFSCQDFSVDTLARELLKIPSIKAWKIEGRKKGPHYVYTTVSAYRLLRDFPDDPQKRKEALSLLSQSLSRVTTHYGLTDRDNPIQSATQTGSGKIIGQITIENQDVFTSPSIELLPGDLLRVGSEDTPGHFIQKIKATMTSNQPMRLDASKNELPLEATPVFLIDRRQADIQEKIDALEAELKEIKISEIPSYERSKNPRSTGSSRKRAKQCLDITIERKLPKKRQHLKPEQTGFWISEKSLKSVPPRYHEAYWWWAPPVIWPNDQRRLIDLIRRLLKHQVTKIVLNAPWQIALIPETLRSKELELWAGPFCNIANAESITVLMELGFQGVIAAPELTQLDFKNIGKDSHLPLGIILTANWPLGISRTVSSVLIQDAPFASPQGETSWLTQYNQDFWLFPNWKLDLTSKREELEKAGFELFFHINEPVPRGISLRNRPGLWNWDLKLQ